MRATMKRNSAATTSLDKANLKKGKTPDKAKTKARELTSEEARLLVDIACKEADDVLQSMKEPDKKVKTLKPSVRDDVVLLVRKGDPSGVLQYIKSNKKEFISGVFSSVFMSAIRKCLNSRQGSDAYPCTENDDSSKRQKTCPGESKALLLLNSKSDGKASNMDRTSDKKAALQDRIGAGSSRDTETGTS
jgi:hypothetical protein